MQELNYGDDSFDFASYKKDGQMPLLAPGVYEVKVTAKSRRKNKDTGEEVLSERNGVQYPTVVIQRFAIVDPETKGTHSVFENVTSKPYNRGGGALASRVVDNLLAIDESLAASLPKETAFIDAVEVLEQELAAGQTFQAKIGYKALDIDSAVNELKTVDPTDSKAVNAVWNKHTYKTKAFKRLNAPGYNETVTTPSGKVLDARLTIDTFIPASKRQKVGAF